MINHCAYFDCLSIGTNFKKPLGNVTIAEFHLFTYFACLLSIYKKQPVSDWGYMFASTKQGTPFSSEIAEVSDILLRDGLFIENDGVFEITERGQEEYDRFMQMAQMKERENYLRPACLCVLVLPAGFIRGALFNEPELRNSLFSTTKRLLDDPGIELLYEHFNALETAISLDVEDLMTSAVIWLIYLSNTTNVLSTLTVEICQ